MAYVPSIGAPEWLDGFGEWSWPGLKPAVELTPASWVPALPLRLEAPAVPIRLRVQRPRSLPRPLRLARLVMLLAVAGATFALSSHLLAPAAVGPAATVGPSRFDETLTSPIAGSRVASSAAVATEGLPAPPLPRPVTVSVDRGGQHDRLDQLRLRRARPRRPLPRLPAARLRGELARAATRCSTCCTATSSRRARS